MPWRYFPLSISAESFDIALEIFRSEYLDERYLVEQILVAIDTARPVNANDVFSIGDVFAEIESSLYEWKTTFSLHFLEEGTPNNRYFSHLSVV